MCVGLSSSWSRRQTRSACSIRRSSRDCSRRCRQVVRAGHARKLYRQWCKAYGTTVQGPSGELATAPTPGQVLALADKQFDEIGAKFHRSALQAAAERYETHAAGWIGLEAPELAGPGGSAEGGGILRNPLLEQSGWGAGDL